MYDVDEVSDLIPTERITLIAWALALGGTVTTGQVAKELGITRVGAWLLLTKMSRVVPITSDDNRRWYRVNP